MELAVDGVLVNETKYDLAAYLVCHGQEEVLS